MNAKHLADPQRLRDRVRQVPPTADRDPASHARRVGRRAGFRNTLLAWAGLIGLVGIAGPAVAGQTLDVDNVTLPFGLTVDLNGFIDGSSYSDSGQLAGQIVLTVNRPPSTTQTTLGVWCDDIFHDIGLGASGYQYIPGQLLTDNSNNPTDLTKTQINYISDLVAYGDAQMRNPATRASLISGEVQAAIWYVEYNNTAIGNSLAVTSASFTQQDLNDVIAAAYAFDGGAEQLDSLDNSQGELEVPEPASLLLLATGFIGLGMAGFVPRRRRPR